MSYLFVCFLEMHYLWLYVISMRLHVCALSEFNFLNDIVLLLLLKVDLSDST